MAYKTVLVRCQRSRSIENPEGWASGVLRRTTFQKKNRRVRGYFVQMPAGNIVRREPADLRFV